MRGVLRAREAEVVEERLLLLAAGAAEEEQARYCRRSERE